ncbi:cell division control protein 2 homolog [Dioscorea cayenensis subsp. rotundata]|uniref:[RNA-polymerase]-subunit kinase n=1 Tax=Dioscorea cayennensis subsp. rotundata TaxID=55577 RepID=A0AB40B8A8_DIOCR|nr:cell division control protein 2 homolog [Dioscorea cayenensis subsp. rotundata]
MAQIGHERPFQRLHTSDMPGNFDHQYLGMLAIRVAVTSSPNVTGGTPRPEGRHGRGTVVVVVGGCRNRGRSSPEKHNCKLPDSEDAWQRSLRLCFFEAIDLRTGHRVAVKQATFVRYAEDHIEDIPYTSLREIDILSSCRHPNIIRFREFIIDDALHSVFIVMDRAVTDLRTHLILASGNLKEAMVKKLMLQLLLGVSYLHSHGILHRDLKPGNLLLTGVGDMRQLKICDFGLGKRFHYLYEEEGTAYDLLSQTVVTQWYRSPELLLGDEKYTAAIDVWSVGCIMAEMVTGKPLFPGKSKIDQLDMIFMVMGTIGLKSWPGLDKLDMARYFLGGPERYNTLRLRVPPTKLSRPGYDLLKRLLEVDPRKRISAEAALDHSWFSDLFISM